MKKFMYLMGLSLIYSFGKESVWISDISYSETKYFFFKKKATFTKPIITGTSISGPTTAAKASPEFIPNMAMATAMANSKLLLAAVNDKVVACF